MVPPSTCGKSALSAISESMHCGSAARPVTSYPNPTLATMDWLYDAHESAETSPGGQIDLPLWGDEPPFYALALNIVLHIVSRFQLWVSWQFEWIHATAFSILCFFARSRSRGRSRPDSAAVVVMGAGEGVTTTLFTCLFAHRPPC